jgi:hypothetical protein
MGYKDALELSSLNIGTKDRYGNERLAWSLNIGMIKPVPIISSMYTRISLFDKYIQLCAFEREDMQTIISTKLDEITEDIIVDGYNDIIAQFAAGILGK